MNKPIVKICQKSLNIILYGNEEGRSEMDMDFDETVQAMIQQDYEGIVNMLKRWFAMATVRHSRLGRRIYGIENL